MNQLRLCSRWRALASQLASSSRHSIRSLVTGSACRNFVAGRKSASGGPPPPHDLFVRPALGHLEVQPHQHVQVVINHREPADSHRKNFSKFSQPVMDP